MRCTILIALLITMVVGLIGCSGGGGGIGPDSDTPLAMDSQHYVWAAVDFSWDGISDGLDVIPNRRLAKHYNVTQFLMPGYISLAIIGWNPVTKVLTVKATIENPLPLDGYDVRGILMNLGEKKLVNADDYTKIFDMNTPPVANPFRAYAKDEAGRKFWGCYADPSQYIKSETFEIYFPGELYASFIVTASWPGNAKEPYDIVSIEQSGTLYESGGSLDVTIEVLDWQDVTADDVVIEANPVTGGDVHLTQVDATHWQTTLTNSGGAPEGDYELWVAAYDAVAPHALYNKFTVHVYPDITGWCDPILVSGEPGVDEILPRLVLGDGDYWVIYTDGTDALAKKSTDGGDTWSAPMTIGAYAGIDTIHALLGGDNCIYVQYQRSDAKYTYVSKYDGSWATPVQTSYHGMTLPPYSCELGIGADGHLYDMTTGSWSTFGFRSEFPYDITSWLNDPIESFYHGIYSINDGFIQGVATPKFFFVHEDDDSDNTELDYAWYDGGWDKGPARTGTVILIEPAIAPESDNPYHCVLGIYDGVDYQLEYMRYDAWPPSSPTTVILAAFLTEEPIFHSVSVEGGIVSVLYDADGDVCYKESTNGGDSFSAYEVLGGGGSGGACAYSHIRHDAYSPKLVAAYAEEESGDYNIYIRYKT